MIEEKTPLEKRVQRRLSFLSHKLNIKISFKEYISKQRKIKNLSIKITEQNEIVENYQNNTSGLHVKFIEIVIEKVEKYNKKQNYPLNQLSIKAFLIIITKKLNHILSNINFLDYELFLKFSIFSFVIESTLKILSLFSKSKASRVKL